MAVHTVSLTTGELKAVLRAIAYLSERNGHFEDMCEKADIEPVDLEDAEYELQTQLDTLI